MKHQIRNILKIIAILTALLALWGCIPGRRTGDPKVTEKADTNASDTGSQESTEKEPETAEPVVTDAPNLDNDNVPFRNLSLRIGDVQSNSSVFSVSIIRTADELRSFYSENLSVFEKNNIDLNGFVKLMKGIDYSITCEEFFGENCLSAVRVPGLNLKSDDGISFIPETTHISVNSEQITVEVSNRCSYNNSVFWVFSSVEKEYGREKIEAIHNWTLNQGDTVSLPYNVKISARLYDHGNGHVSSDGIYYPTYIGSVEDVETYKSLNRMGYMYVHDEIEKSVPDILDKYDEEFFKENVVMAAEIVMPDNRKASVADVVKYGSNVYFDVEYAGVLKPASENDRIREHLILFVEISRANLADLTGSPDDNFAGRFFINKAD